MDLFHERRGLVQVGKSNVVCQLWSFVLLFHVPVAGSNALFESPKLKNAIYTVGHSTHEMSTFINLLCQHEITAICDVRSHPFSRFVPQFSRVNLKEVLVGAGIAYVFLGKELGGRSDNPACYRQGKVQFDRLAKEPSFSDGIGRVLQGMHRYRIALMCAERDPLECHRALLVGRRLFEDGVSIIHIHADGAVETHSALESRLLAVNKLPGCDMFRNREELVVEAYRIQGERIAHQNRTIGDDERATSL